MGKVLLFRCAAGILILVASLTGLPCSAQVAQREQDSPSLRPERYKAARMAKQPRSVSPQRISTP